MAQRRWATGSRKKTAPSLSDEKTSKKPNRPLGMKPGVKVQPSRKSPLTEAELKVKQERNKEDADKVAPCWRKALRAAKNNGILGSTERVTPKRKGKK